MKFLLTLRAKWENTRKSSQESQLWLPEVKGASFWEWVSRLAVSDAHLEEIQLTSSETKGDLWAKIYVLTCLAKVLNKLR